MLCLVLHINLKFSKTCLKGPLKKKTKIDFQDQLSLNADHKHCRMLQGEHSAILLTFIKLPFAIKTGFTVVSFLFYSRYSKTCLKPPLKNRQNKDLKDKW